jgi:hypothetical protein
MFQALMDFVFHGSAVWTLIEKYRDNWLVRKWIKPTIGLNHGQGFILAS